MIKRLLVVQNSLVALGGVERRSEDLCRYALRHGCLPELLVLRENGAAARLFENLGIKVHFIPLYMHRKGRSPLVPNGLGPLRQFLERSGHTHVLGLQPPSHYFVREAAKGLPGVKVMAMERLSYRDRGWGDVWWDHRLAKHTHRWVCVSHMLRREMVRRLLPAGKISAVLNGLTVPSGVPPDPDWAKRLVGQAVVGWVGILARRKRPDFLLRAWAMIPAALRQQASVLLVGGEDEFKVGDLAVLARQLGVEASVAVAGPQTNPHAFFALMNAFVFTSVHEGLGNVWGEAMLHGLPVFSTDVAPMNDYLRHGENARLFPARSEEALARQLEEFLASPERFRAMAERGRADAQAMFDPDASYGKLLGLFDAPSL